MSNKILIDSGLSKEQAKIYLFLLENGLASAKIIASKTGIGRALAYKVLEQLIERGLAEKREDIGTVARFFPAHPKRLKETLVAHKERAEETLGAFEKAYGGFVSSFNLLSGKPGVQFFEGQRGLSYVYDDILEVGEGICIISSPISEHRATLLPHIREQIKKQVAQGIRTKAITPIGNQELATPIADDGENLIERKQIPAAHLPIPAQVIIYGDRVAITNFKETLITVLMESEYIAETFRALFEYVWEKE